jgi:hypothetical protein
MSVEAVRLHTDGVLMTTPNLSKYVKPAFSRELAVLPLIPTAP